jgi:hypothetical protein
VQTRRISRSASRDRERELPMRGQNPIGKHMRGQAEQDYAGDITRRLAVVRGKRLRTADADNRYGRGVTMGATLQRKARNEGRRPRKLAASAGKPKEAGKITRR